jgi:hypothetical protein
MATLYTFGCSFTSYHWPTWADLFGLEFEHFENWGIPGIGNVAIANRVAECFVKNNITSDDTVIIQWSGHLRNDYHLFNNAISDRDPGRSWKTKGSMFNFFNDKLYDKKWLTNFFNEESYIMYSLNAIYTTLELVKSKNCKWKMTSIGDFDKLSTDIAINPTAYNEVLPNNKNNLWDIEMFLPYKKIWEDDNWIQPIGSYCWKSCPEELYTWDVGVDAHPSPQMYVDWLYNILKPSLYLDNAELNSNQKSWIKQCQEIKSNVNNLDAFTNIVHLELHNFNKEYRGY